MCVGLWDGLSLEDQTKTFSKRRLIRTGTVEMDADRRPKPSGADEGVGSTGNPLEQKVRIFTKSKTVIFRLQALSVAQPDPTITTERGLLLPTAVPITATHFVSLPVHFRGVGIHTLPASI